MWDISVTGNGRQDQEAISNTWARYLLQLMARLAPKDPPPTFEMGARPEDEYMLIISPSTLNTNPTMMKHWVHTSEITDEAWMLLNFAEGTCFISHGKGLSYAAKEKMHQSQSFIITSKFLEKYNVAWNFKPPQPHFTLCWTKSD